MESRLKTLPKSRSNTRISVLTGTSSNTKFKSVSSSASESTRLVYNHHGGVTALGGSGSGIGGRRALGRNNVVAGGGEGGYGLYQPLMPPSNPVEDCLHAGLTGLGWCMVSWLIGVLLLVLEYARRWGGAHSSNPDTASGTTSRHGGGGGPPWLVFAPFWIGDALALVVLARIVSKVSSVRFAAPTRNRGARRIDGRERSTGSMNDLSGHGSNHSSNHGGGNSFTPVSLDYFPLLQRVVVTAIGVFLLLVLLTVQQVLVCCRWGRVATGDAGVPSALAVAAPLLVLEAFCLARVALIRTQGWLSGTTWLLLLLLTLSVVLRSGGDSSNEFSRAFRSYPWLECLAPLWALDLLYAGVAGYVAANTCAGRFVMAPTQGLCFALLVTALVGSTVAEMLLTGDPRLHKLNDRVARMEYLRLYLPLLLVVVSLMAFYLAIFLSAEHSVSRLISTHGYDDPLPLCETTSGWEWSGAGKAAWGLLGDVSVRAEKKVALPAGLSRSKKAANVVSRSDMAAADNAFENKLYQRTDSGQYADIYESL